MQLQDILYSQGFGTRRVCAGLVQHGHVQVYQGEVLVPVDDAATEFEAEGLRFNVQGQDWPYAERAYIMLHKPAGTECSHKPSTYPSIYSLLPAPLRHRPQKSAVQGVQAVGRLDQDTTGLLHKPAGTECSHKPSTYPSIYSLLPPPLRQRPQKSAVQGVQAVGRLDQDTTGMLLLTDDGRMIHRMSSPKHHVPKVYEVTLKHPASAQQIQRLLEGVVLDDDPKPVRAAACEALDSHRLRLTLTQGKYHQVKRMVAAVSNRVEGLHRSQIGQLTLDPDLLPGQWRWLGPQDLALLEG